MAAHKARVPVQRAVANAQELVSPLLKRIMAARAKLNQNQRPTAQINLSKRLTNAQETAILINMTTTLTENDNISVLFDSANAPSIMYMDEQNGVLRELSSLLLSVRSDTMTFSYMESNESGENRSIITVSIANGMNAIAHMALKNMDEARQTLLNTAIRIF